MLIGKIYLKKIYLAGDYTIVWQCWVPIPSLTFNTPSRKMADSLIT